MSCEACRSSSRPDVPFSMAFQPIYDAENDRVWGYEALVRGLDGQGAAEVIDQVRPEQRYRFDQDCRVKAIELAARLFPRDQGLKLSINFMPNAVYDPAGCLEATLAAAHRHDFPQSAIMFEFTEDEQVADTAHLRAIVDEYRRHGFTTALDDFGAGHAGLSLLVEFQPDLIKIDMAVIRAVDTSAVRQAVVRGIVSMAADLGLVVLVEGVETEAELETLRAMGIGLFQGYLFARPAFEALPPITRPGVLPPA